MKLLFNYKVFFWAGTGAAIYADYHIYKNMGLQSKDLIKVFAASIAAIAALFAFYQLKANHEWNRRHSAMVEAEKNRDKVTKAIVTLNKSIDYRERQDPYSLRELHEALCDNCDHTKNPDLTDDGKKIKHNIFVILNYYEYLAVGINNKVFDERVLKELLKGSLIKSFTLFGDYIKHVREKHTKNPNMFISLQKLAIRWSKPPLSKRVFDYVFGGRGSAD